MYCGSSTGAQDAYRTAAADLGTLLARSGIELVYGGGRVGLMGVVADAVLAAGGRVVGVIPQALMDRELGHAGIQDLRVVADMHVRKMTMAGLADAFIALPGGWGTLEELSEMLTWLQLGIHAKPVGLLQRGGVLRRTARVLPDDGRRTLRACRAARATDRREPFRRAVASARGTDGRTGGEVVSDRRSAVAGTGVRLGGRRAVSRRRHPASVQRCCSRQRPAAMPTSAATPTARVSFCGQWPNGRPVTSGVFVTVRTCAIAASKS